MNSTNDKTSDVVEYQVHKSTARVLQEYCLIVLLFI